MLDRSDPDHQRCAKLIGECAEQLVIPVCVLVEVEYMVRPWPEAFDGLLADIDEGVFSLLELPPSRLERVGELLTRYRNLPLGLVDATVLTAAEMLSEDKLATLDHRHFTVVRPDHVEALTLLP